MSKSNSIVSGPFQNQFNKRNLFCRYFSVLSKEGVIKGLQNVELSLVLVNFNNSQLCHLQLIKIPICIQK